MRTVWSFHSASSLVFGRNAISGLGDVVARLGGNRVWLVTDATLVRAGLVDRILAPLKAAHMECAVFDGGQPEPALAIADVCAARAREFRPDVVLGLGGGSNMDLAKLTAAMLAHNADARAFVGDDQIPGPVLPLVCIPTTSGTGSEVSGASVMTDEIKKTKVGILSNHLRPRAAVVDPLLTVSCPPKVTADSGIDALTHAIEAYCAVENADFPLPEGERSIYQGRTPMGDMLAESAITQVGRYLARAVHDGSDLEAREGMSLAATLAGLAFSNVGVAVVHALEYPVGGATHCSHGAGNGLLLPYVMRYNLATRIERTARIGELLGVATSGISREAAAEETIGAIERLRTEIGIPTRLRDLGATREQLPEFAAKAFSVKRILRVNPRYPTEADLLEILSQAF